MGEPGRVEKFEKRGGSTGVVFIDNMLIGDHIIIYSHRPTFKSK